MVSERQWHSTLTLLMLYPFPRLNPMKYKMNFVQIDLIVKISYKNTSQIQLKRNVKGLRELSAANDRAVPARSFGHDINNTET